MQNFHVFLVPTSVSLNLAMQLYMLTEDDNKCLE